MSERPTRYEAAMRRAVEALADAFVFDERDDGESIAYELLSDVCDDQGCDFQSEVDAAIERKDRALDDARAIPSAAPPEQLTLEPQPTPPREPTPIEQRDEVLAALERNRKHLVTLGRDVAAELVQTNGKVTSVEVLAELRTRGHGPLLDSADPRWLGAVFSPKKWTRCGLANTGSKGRAVSVWALR